MIDSHAIAPRTRPIMSNHRGTEAQRNSIELESMQRLRRQKDRASERSHLLPHPSAYHFFALNGPGTGETIRSKILCVSVSLWLGTLLLLLLAPTAFAQTTISAIRVGFPAARKEAGARTTLFKSGAWTPVYVDLVAGPDGFDKGTLTVKAPDCDEVETSYTIEVGPIPGGARQTVQTFTRPGSLSPEIRVALTGTARPAALSTLESALPVYDRLYLFLDDVKPALIDRLLERADNDEDEERPVGGHVARLDKVDELPTAWFGYSAVDALFVNAANKALLKDLALKKHAGRLQALREWVRRGGRVVFYLEAGHQGKTLLPILFPDARVKVSVEAIKNPDALAGLENWVQVRKRFEPPVPFELTKLLIPADGSVEVMARSADEGRQPLVVRFPHGMGQVTLLSFGLGQPAFEQWPRQGRFWRKLLAELGASPRGTKDRFNALGMKQDDSFDLSAGLRDRLEEFSVSSISFGWVALFILVYIAIIGPLDYLFLKKVVKRLEFTWITFPTVVILVSVGAYFLAHRMKKDDLLVNKIDLIDIDLVDNTTYGHGWFALFSPKIASYGVRVEPGWAKGKEDGTVVTWMGRPDDRLSGFGRARGQAMFQRDYRYGGHASSLQDVPIQVWTSKVFQSSWMQPGLAPFEADLKLDQDLHVPVGSITSKLPVDLEDVVLIHSAGAVRGKVYHLGKLAAGATMEIDLDRQRATNLMDWTPVAGADADIDALMRRICFHEIYPEDGRERNNNVRSLDQSWRLRLDSEVMLFARCPRRSGLAGAIVPDPKSPSRLQLGVHWNVPDIGAGGDRLTQDTYVRVFIPIKPAKPKP